MPRARDSKPPLLLSIYDLPSAGAKKQERFGVLSLTENTHRDKSLAGFSICCLRNSICLQLDMFATQTRDLSHIELVRSGNISSSSKARTYRVNGVDISTKNKSKNRRIFSFYSCSFCLYKVLGLAHNAFDRSNAMLALSGISKFSAKNITHLRARLIIFLFYA